MWYSRFCVASGGLGVVVKCILLSSFDVVGYELGDCVWDVGVVELVDEFVCVYSVEGFGHV